MGPKADLCSGATGSYCPIHRLLKGKGREYACALNIVHWPPSRPTSRSQPRAPSTQPYRLGYSTAATRLSKELDNKRDPSWLFSPVLAEPRPRLSVSASKRKMLGDKQSARAILCYRSEQQSCSLPCGLLCPSFWCILPRRPFTSERCSNGEVACRSTLGWAATLIRQVSELNEGCLHL